MRLEPNRLVLALSGLLMAVLLAPALSNAGQPPPGGRAIFASAAKRVIPDAGNGGGVLAKVKVRRGGQIRDLEVGVRINHSFDADLNIYLVSPQGRFVELSTDNGGSGNNYGSGPNSCGGGGSFTIFDDEAVRSIRGGAAPFLGPFRPQTPLRALDGNSIRGTWRLLVFDDDEGGTGVVGCFALGAILR